MSYYDSCGDSGQIRVDDIFAAVDDNDSIGGGGDGGSSGGGGSDSVAVAAQVCL